MLVVGAPREYSELIGCQVVHQESGSFRFVHAFFACADAYRNWLEGFVAQLAPDAVLWVSWPKKASKVTSDMDENLVRDFALPFGIVDIKVCAVDETWSGLKFMVRKDLRSQWPLKGT